MESSKGCPECGTKNLFWNKSKGEIICKGCGYVIDDKLVDFSQEWRDFDESGSEKSGRRAGAPITFLQPDIKTEVGTKADLFKLNKSERDKFYRLRIWQRRTSTSIEQNLNTALAEIRRIGSFLSLPNSVQEEAARLYTMALQKSLIQGRGIDRMVAGAVYLACRNSELPKTLDEVSDAANLNRKEVGKAYKFLTRKLEIKIMPLNPVDFVNKISSKLSLSAKTQTQAVKIIEKAQRIGLISGKSPSAIAAAAVYVAALSNKEKRIQQKIAEAANVTEVTLRNRFQELTKALKIKVKVR